MSRLILPLILVGGAGILIYFLFFGPLGRQRPMLHDAYLDTKNGVLYVTETVLHVTSYESSGGYKKIGGWTESILKAFNLETGEKTAEKSYASDYSDNSEILYVMGGKLWCLAGGDNLKFHARDVKTFELIASSKDIEQKNAGLEIGNDAGWDTTYTKMVVKGTDARFYIIDPVSYQAKLTTENNFISARNIDYTENSSCMVNGNTEIGFGSQERRCFQRETYTIDTTVFEILDPEAMRNAKGKISVIPTKKDMRFSRRGSGRKDFCDINFINPEFLSDESKSRHMDDTCYIEGNNVFIFSKNKNVSDFEPMISAVDALAETPKLLWTVQIPIPTHDKEKIESDDNKLLYSVVSNGKTIVVFGSSITCIDNKSGKVKWQFVEKDF